MYRLCLQKEKVESINHWNGKVIMLTTLWLLASDLLVIIEIRGASVAGNDRGHCISETMTIPVAIHDTFFFHAFFIRHIYLCVQCLIPYSSSPFICYPVNASLHYVCNQYCICSSFSGGLHAIGQIWSHSRSPNVPIIWLIIYQEYMVTWIFVKFMLAWYGTCIYSCWIRVWVWVWVWVTSG